MKKIMVVAVGVLFSTLVFANGTVESGQASSVGVMKSGSNLIKVFYKSVKSNDVKLSIYNENFDVVYTETLKKTEGFMRPYNFANLPEGRYTIQIVDETGTQTETVTYGAAKIEKSVNIVKVTSEEDRYLLTGFSQSADKITVRIFDGDGKTAYDQVLHVDGKFAQLYNLKGFKDSFSIEVSDANGILKNFGR